MKELRVDIEGIPLKVWSKNTFSRITSKWEELLDFDEQEDGYLHSKRVCIKTIAYSSKYGSEESDLEEGGRKKSSEKEKLLLRCLTSWTFPILVILEIPRLYSKNDVDAQKNASKSVVYGRRLSGYIRFQEWSGIEVYTRLLPDFFCKSVVVVLEDLVSDVQSAFVVKRQILDGLFILNELFQWCKMKKKHTIVFKVRLRKVHMIRSVGIPLDESLKRLRICVEKCGEPKKPGDLFSVLVSFDHGESTYLDAKSDSSWSERCHFALWDEHNGKKHYGLNGSKVLVLKKREVLEFRFSTPLNRVFVFKWFAFLHTSISFMDQILLMVLERPKRLVNMFEATSSSYGWISSRRFNYSECRGLIDRSHSLRRYGQGV
ncbi:hypothetical protein Tco_0956836 [Tanacetum coccineum]